MVWDTEMFFDIPKIKADYIKDISNTLDELDCLMVLEEDFYNVINRVYDEDAGTVIRAYLILNNLLQETLKTTKEFIDYHPKRRDRYEGYSKGKIR